MKVRDKDLESNIVEVQIKGAVRAPGTYYIRRGSPLSEAISQCGGVLDNGILIEDIDIHAPVYENMFITVPMHYTLKKNAYEKK